MLMFTKGRMDKARECRSVEDLITFAKESDIELTEERAKEYYMKLVSPIGELSGDELDAVAGGGCGEKPTCPNCGSANVKMSGTQDYPLLKCQNCGYTNSSSVI